MDDAEVSKWFAQNALHNWNATVPEGTAVRYYPISGEDSFVETVTRSEAWMLGSGEPVVLIKGRTGGVSILHCRVQPGPREVAPTAEQVPESNEEET